METQTLRLGLYSMRKHSRLIIDGGDELKWLDTLKRPIKCTLGKKGEEKDAGFMFSWFLSTFVDRNWRKCQCLYCKIHLTQL